VDKLYRVVINEILVEISLQTVKIDIAGLFSVLLFSILQSRGQKKLHRLEAQGLQLLQDDFPHFRVSSCIKSV